MNKYLLLFLFFPLLIGCKKVEEKPKPVPVVVSQGPAQFWDVGDNLIKYPLPDDADDYFLQFFKAPAYSFGVASARKKITARSHDNHDLVLYVHRGTARFHVGDRDWIANTGDVIYVPRGAVYSAESSSDRSFNYFAVYHPPFDGEDITSQEPPEKVK